MPKSNLTEEQRKANHRAANQRWRLEQKALFEKLSDEEKQAIRAKKKKAKKEWAASNTEAVKEYNSKWKKDNPHYFVNKHLVSEYGITKEQYDLMAQEQDHKCYVCGVNAIETPRKKLFVDHCHTTGSVRKLLCQHCNSALGLVKENTDTLAALIAYVYEHSEEQMQKKAQEA